MVHTVEPNTGNFVPQTMLYMAEEISRRYPDVRLAGIPVALKDSNEEYPFALISAQTGIVLKELKESEININFIFRWLYEHDTVERGQDYVRARHVEEQKRIAQLAKDNDPANQTFQENLDFVHSMARSDKHVYKHNGRKFGA